MLQLESVINIYKIVLGYNVTQLKGNTIPLTATIFYNFLNKTLDIGAKAQGRWRFHRRRNGRILLTILYHTICEMRQNWGFCDDYFISKHLLILAFC